MKPFETVIPAITSVTFVTRRQHIPAKKKFFICGYLSQPHKRLGKGKADYDLVSRWQKWRAHARLHLQAALFSEGWYNNQPISEEGWTVHV